MFLSKTRRFINFVIFAGFVVFAVSVADQGIEHFGRMSAAVDNLRTLSGN